MMSWHITISQMCFNRIVRLLELLTFSTMLFAGSAGAQNSDMYIYPAKGQDQNKQNEDRYDCHSWAVSQTGFDGQLVRPDLIRASHRQIRRAPPGTSITAPLIFTF